MRLRVVHVVESLRPQVGSAVVSLSGLVEALRTNDIESQVVTAHTGDNADVIHIHGWGYAGAMNAARAARSRGQRYVISPHGKLCGQSWFTRLRQRRLIGSASSLLALNEVEAHALIDAGAHQSIHVLPYGLSFADYEAVNQAGGAAEAECLLMLGTLHPRGGSVALLKALAELGPLANGWQVLLSGHDDGDWRPMLEAALERKGAADRVRFVAAAEHDAQKELLASASVVVAPGLHIDFPLSILQAAASGVPVVATTCVAPPGLNGEIRVCEPRRDALRAALQSVLAQSRNARRLSGDKLRCAARAALDWSVLAPLWAGMYRQLV